MYLTETEILSQQEALEKSFETIRAKREELREFLDGGNRFVFLGCGSSYMMAKTGQRLFGTKRNTEATAIAGGEYLIDPDFYREVVQGSTVVALSRSGMTSEIVRAVGLMKKLPGVRVLSITMKEENDLAGLSDLSLVFPWAYDESVCQTRTVSNFYEILLLLSALRERDEELIREVQDAVGRVSGFLCGHRARMEELAKREFTDVVVLADGVLCGLAEEAALAFTEIALVGGRYFHLLDYRHGPKVLNGEHTLTIAALHPGAMQLQRDMARDLSGCGGTLVLFCPEGDEAGYEGDWTVPCQGSRFETVGFFLIAAAQMLAFSKALERGVNPDKPQGLDAFITLR